ncbi:glutamate-gated chloride channel-like [Varroa jacobsoni]|uniref:glutamate-gated chloride channel-like n=1 Tax=Varroa jacobsoni TaxID=62625 RepID=UPI000BF61F68|nr:glutamate-gated chloride channel-like [Varroa jacobsoni]
MRRAEVWLVSFFLARCTTKVATGSEDRWNATLQRYNPSDKPRLNTNVIFDLYLRDMRNINSHDQTFEAQITFRQQWTEPRLSHKHDGNLPYQKVADPSLIWTPDTFFSNELEGYRHSVSRDNVFLRVKRNGQILLSERASLKLSCPMNLAAFPFDTQVCGIYISSYGHIRSILSYEWKDIQPIQMNKNQLPTTFELRQYNTSICSARTNTGEYSCIKVEFFLHRRWNHYMLHVFIPLTMLNVVAWLTFWVRDVPMRVTIIMFTFALAVHGITTLNQDLPQTPYAKMIDYFTAITLLFILGAMIEFVFIKWIDNEDEKNGSANKIDAACRLAYPVAYFGFLVVYFIAALLA